MQAERAGVPVGSVAILGLGVMGGSLARALSALATPPRVVAWSPEPDECAAALDAGAIQAVASDPEGAASGVEFVVLAVPLDAVGPLLGRLAPVIDRWTVVTDVASLKAPVRDAVERSGLAARWAGSHPLCGSEMSGFEASRRDLYRGATVYVTPSAEATGAGDVVSAFWSALGARPETMDAVAHDRLMAATSHLPQLTANALAEVFRLSGIAAGLLGPGGRDVTRLAASSPHVWGAILRQAPEELTSHLRSLARRVGELADLVEANDGEALAEWMERSRAWKLEDPS